MGGNISPPVRYSYLSVFTDDNADIFVSSLLILYCSLSSLILSSIVTIGFYVFSIILLLKRAGLYDATVASITKQEYGFAEHFL